MFFPKKPMEDTKTRGNGFRTNARYGAKVWEDIEDDNRNPRMVRHRLTKKGTDYLTSRGLKFPEILGYENFQDLIREHELTPGEHYEVSLIPISASALSGRYK